MQLPTPTSGGQLVAANAQNATLNRAAGTGAGGNTVIAPQTTVNSKGGDSYNLDLRAKNTETTYQRTMNSQYVPS
jgi:hypothetical protein